jgi:hypothetical protein
LIALLAFTSAQAKTKTATTRVAESFQMLPRDWRPSAQPPHARFAPMPQYIVNRPSFFAAGKLMLYRECEVELVQDPGETTCKMVMGWI